MKQKTVSEVINKDRDDDDDDNNVRRKKTTEFQNVSSLCSP